MLEATRRHQEVEAWSATVFGGGPSWVEIALTVVLVPSLCEELTHRGLLAGGLAPRLGRLGAVAASTLLFAALHLEPARILATAIVGGAAGTVAAWSRSLWPAIALHAVNNAIVAALSLGHAPALRRAIDTHAAAALAIAVGLAIAGLAVVRATSPRASATVQP